MEKRKTCRVCLKEKQTEMFPTSRGAPSGRVCRECSYAQRRARYAALDPAVVKERSRASYIRNREARLEDSRKHYAENKEFYSEYCKAWRASNRDKCLGYSKTYKSKNLEKERKRQREYRARNPHKSKEWAQKNRPRVREITSAWAKRNRDKCNARARTYFAKLAGNGGTLTAEQWQDILELFDYRCAYCLEKAPSLHMEHFLPVSLDGATDADNVVPACIKCNSRKHNRLVFSWVPMMLR